jgi:hypothetical protein
VVNGQGAVTLRINTSAAAKIALLALGNVSVRLLGARESMYLKQQIRSPKRRALMHRRRLNMPMKPSALRLNDLGKWLIKLARQRITLSVSNPGRWH